MSLWENRQDRFEDRIESFKCFIVAATISSVIVTIEFMLLQIVKLIFPFSETSYFWFLVFFVQTFIIRIIIEIIDPERRKRRQRHRAEFQDSFHLLFYEIKTLVTGGKRAEFLNTSFGMFAKLVMTDNRLSKEEISVLESICLKELNLTKRQYDKVTKVFNEAMESKRTFEGYLNRYLEIFEHDHVHHFLLIQLLFKLATADRKLNSQQEAILKRTIRSLGLPDYLYNKLLNRHLKQETSFDSFKNDNDRDKSTYTTSSNLTKYFEILECDENVSIKEIKAAYRKMALKHHPDRLIANGLPREVITLANEKFNEINNAYKQICAALHKP